MLKFVAVGLIGAAFGGAVTVLLPSRTENFAFATSDGRGLLIYACATADTSEQSATNARAAHRFFEAELEVQTEAQVMTMVADMAQEDSSAVADDLSVTLRSGDDLRRELSRNLQATFGCRLVKSQLADG